MAKVQCVENGKIYGSVLEASRHINRSDTALRSALDGRTETCAGFHWRYYEDELASEEWRPVVGFEGKYEVSNCGRVRSLMCQRGKRKQAWYLKGKIDRYGYPVVCLRENGRNKHIPVHRLVATAFIPNPEGKETVNHRSGLKTDNRVSNLEWATQSEQEFHKYRVLGQKSAGFSKEYMNRHKQRVRCVETGIVYESAAEAGRQLRNTIETSSIIAVCKKKKYHLTAWGYHWEYADGD